MSASVDNSSVHVSGSLYISAFVLAELMRALRGMVESFAELEQMSRLLLRRGR